MVASAFEVVPVTVSNTQESVPLGSVAAGCGANRAGRVGAEHFYELHVVGNVIHDFQVGEDLVVGNVNRDGVLAQVIGTGGGFALPPVVFFFSGSTGRV